MKYDWAERMHGSTLDVFEQSKMLRWIVAGAGRVLSINKRRLPPVCVCALDDVVLHWIKAYMDKIKIKKKLQYYITSFYCSFITWRRK